MVRILIMLAKMGTLGLLEIKLFWKKVYDVIISVHDVTNKILSRDLSYNIYIYIYIYIYMVRWPKVCCSSISMRKVMITSVL